jgi:transcriptional regulator with XRE-family HTH domain
LTSLDRLLCIGKNIAMRIKIPRERQKISQEELAARSGISRGDLARLETGRHDPTITTLEKLAKALKVPVGKLLK